MEALCRVTLHQSESWFVFSLTSQINLSQPWLNQYLYILSKRVVLLIDPDNVFSDELCTRHKMSPWHKRYQQNPNQTLLKTTYDDTLWRLRKSGSNICILLIVNSISYLNNRYRWMQSYWFIAWIQTSGQSLWRRGKLHKHQRFLQLWMSRGICGQRKRLQG